MGILSLFQGLALFEAPGPITIGGSADPNSMTCVQLRDRVLALEERVRALESTQPRPETSIASSPFWRDDASALRGNPFQSKARSSDEYAINHNGAEVE